jgi:hypothetical protein
MHSLGPLSLVALTATTLLLTGPGCSCGTPEPLAPLADVTPVEPPETQPSAVLRVAAGGGANDVIVPAAQVPEGCTPGDRPESAVLLGEDRGLADVIASLSRGPTLPGAPAIPTLSAAERRVAVEDCALVPRSIAAARGDTLIVTNRDNRYHTVHLWRIDGGRERSLQTIALAPGETDVSFLLDQAGLYRLRNDQIPWMRGLLLVHRPEERALVTGTDGSAELTELPAGSWDVHLVHETLGSADTTVEINPGASAAVYGTLPAP